MNKNFVYAFVLFIAPAYAQAPLEWTQEPQYPQQQKNQLTIQEFLEQIHGFISSYDNKTIKSFCTIGNISYPYINWPEVAQYKNPRYTKAKSVTRTCSVRQSFKSLTGNFSLDLAAKVNDLVKKTPMLKIIYKEPRDTNNNVLDWIMKFKNADPTRSERFIYIVSK